MSAHKTILLVTITLSLITTTAFSQSPESHPDDIYWSDQFCALGGGMAGGFVWDLAVYENKIVVAGEYKSIGSSPDIGIATYDGATWTSLSGGLGGNVYTLKVWNGLLVAGGWFSKSDLAPSENIAAWDGTQWIPLGEGLNGIVRTLGIWNGNLVAAGDFTKAGETEVQGIALWDGIQWSALGAGITRKSYHDVFCMLEYNGNLLVGGSFDSAGAKAIPYLASWDGLSWSQFSPEVDSTVNSIIDYNGMPLISESGGGVRLWDGSSFIDMNNGLSIDPQELLLHLGQLYAVPSVYQDSVKLYTLDDDEWTSVDIGARNFAWSLCSWNDALVVAGRLQLLDSWTEPSLAIYQDSSWTFPDGLGLRGFVNDLETFDDKLIMSGMLTFNWLVPI